jgi:CBS domain-containing protein
MADHEVGTLVVLGTSQPRRAAGVVTDRDIALRCVAGRLDPGETPVSEIMSTPAHQVDEQTPIDEAITRMAQLGVRRLVVTGDDEVVVGILSLDDVLHQVVEEITPIGRLLAEQKPRIPA